MNEATESVKRHQDRLSGTEKGMQMAPRQIVGYAASLCMKLCQDPC